MPSQNHVETLRNTGGNLCHVKLLLLAFSLSLCVIKPPLAAAAGSVGFVQSVAASGAASTLSVAFPQNTVAGDIIMVAFDFSFSVSPSLVTDSQGNTFTEVEGPLASPGRAESAVYYAKNITGGADTVTVNLTGNSPYLEVYLTEYSGADPINPIDAAAGAAGSAGSVWSGSATTTVAGDVIYGFCVGDASCSAGSGFVTRSNFHSNLIEDETSGGPGSYGASGSANSGWTMQMVALKPTLSTAPVITSATAVSGTVGTAMSYQITATNAPTSFGATGLPSGLTLNSSTGLISGTPTAAGTSNITVSATNGAGAGTATLSLTAFPTAKVVQSAANHASGTANALSFAFPQNTGAGDVILVGLDFASNASLSSIYDSQGNSFTQVGNVLASPGGANSVVYYANNIRGGADTVTVNLTANSSYIEVYLTEYSGLNQTNPIDAQAGAAGGAGSVSSGSATTTFPGDVIYGYCVGDISCTVGSGFTALSTFDGNLLEVETAGSAGSYAATGYAASSWTMQMVALKPAASEGAQAPGAPPTQGPASAAVSLSNTLLNFVSALLGIASSPQTVTVTNTGGSNLNITSVAITGANASEFSEVNTCLLSLSPGGQCSIVVLFTPLLSGSGSASLNIADNASGSPQVVSLSGSMGHSVSLSWTASPSGGVVGYNIYRSTTPGGQNLTLLNLAPNVVTYFTDETVSAGATYYYMITAAGSNGAQSGYSNQVSVTVP